MRRIRLFTVLAAMLLSCGIANAQTVKGDVNDDKMLNVKDITALADSVMKDNQSKRLDLNDDNAVNVADVVTVSNLIKETNYFYLGLEMPSKDNYTTIDGVATDYKSIKEVLDAKLELELLSGGERGFLLCPAGWEAKDLALQHENGSYYELTKVETNTISDYLLFNTEDIENDGTYVLKTIEAAEEYKKSLNPLYFWLGTYFPKSNTFPTINGQEVSGIVTTYTSLEDAM